MSDSLGVERVKELIQQGIAGAARHDDEAVGEVLRVLMFEGNKLDCLAFTVGCIARISGTIPAGYRLVNLPVDDTEWDTAQEAHALMVDMLGDYRRGDQERLYNRWLEAEEDVASGVIGLVLSAGGYRQRVIWAQLS